MKNSNMQIEINQRGMPRLEFEHSGENGGSPEKLREKAKRAFRTPEIGDKYKDFAVMTWTEDL